MVHTHGLVQIMVTVASRIAVVVRAAVMINHIRIVIVVVAVQTRTHIVAVVVLWLHLLLLLLVFMDGTDFGLRGH